MPLFPPFLNNTLLIGPHPANNFIKPNTANMDAVESSLLPENERRLALCLAPLSKAFYIATGSSKLQVSEDYQELIRVMVWHNRSRVKQGLKSISPAELEQFLKQEMTQDFDDLGIEIDDFLEDLIKIRNVEQYSFDTYNKYIQEHSPRSPSTTEATTPNLLEKKTAARLDKSLLDTQQQSKTNSTNETTTQKSSTKPTPTNLMHKFVSVNEPASSNHSVLDKQIILKNKEVHRHVHRYDLRISIKECRSEEDEQRIIKGLLEEFLDTMLSVDKTILVPPYYELDRSNDSFQDLSQSYKIGELESFTKLKRYFSRLGNRNPSTGYVYCSCIVAASTPHSAIMTKVSQILQESKMSLWPRSSNHENVGRIGWLLYSLQDMDANRLKTILTTLTGYEIGVKWMRINTEYGSKRDKELLSTPGKAIKALVLEGPQDQVYELRDTLSTWYGSKSTSLPDAVRMQLIPPLDALSDGNKQENYGAALAKQASFVSKMGRGTSWELTSNLILDKKEPTTGISLRQIIMGIPSSNNPNYPLFHCVNKGWKEGSTIVFHFLPSNESEARMYISGLIAYLRATTLPWYLDLFKPVACSRSHGTSWDPVTRQITSLMDSNFSDTLQQDPLYDLTESTAALLSSQDITSNSSSIGFYKDTDPIGTFRSNVRSVLKKKGKTSTGTTPTANSTPTHSVSFHPVRFTQKPDETSISHMSDTASKVAGLETRLEKMETQFRMAFARLEAIFSGIETKGLSSVSTDGSGSTNHLAQLAANHPASDKIGGTTDSGAAGTGS